MSPDPSEGIFHRLIVGADSTDEADDAVALAAAIASASGADVFLLNVYPTALFPIRGMTDRKTEELLAERTLQKERRRWNLRANVHTTSSLSIPRALSQHAEDWHAHLIVVGSRAKSPQGHARISPRCRQLLGAGRYGLAIAKRGMAQGKPQLHTIGVGYDAGRESELALDVAAHLAKGARAELKVLSVVDDRLPVLTAAEWMTLIDEDLEAAWELQRKQAIEQAQEALLARGIAASIEAVRGDPAQRLREFSRHLDLLVIGSRRWGTLARVLAGSVGEAMVSDTECSLLIVPRPARPPDDRAKSGAVEQPAVR